MDNPSEMKPEQQMILDAMCKDPLFSRSAKFPQILRYLARYSFPNTPENRKKRRAVEIWKRFYKETNELDTNVRRDIGKLRDRAEDYAVTSAYSEVLKIVARDEATTDDEIALVTFRPNRHQEKALQEFWAPYLTKSSATTIVYTEPLFFHDIEKRIWARDLRINDEREAKLFLLHKHGNFAPARNYVPIGELRALLDMTAWFSKSQVKVEYNTFHHVEYDDIPKANLILLGPPRCNPLMRLLQQASYYTMHDDRIESRSTSNTESRHFQDSATPNDKEGQIIHALVTRLPHPADEELAVTSIASDHTRAIRKVCSVLTNEKEFKKLLDGYELQQESFQMIFRVEVWGAEAIARSLQLVETWPPELKVSIDG